MKGIIFRSLEELVVENLGMGAWNALLDEHSPDHRSYVSAVSYPDEELFALANGVATKMALPLPEVLGVFGRFLFGSLAAKHPTVLAELDTFEKLILAIDSVIHVEVAKLYDEPNLPQIDAKIVNDSEIVVEYRSPRKLCFCAEGLIYGAADHYNKQIEISHTSCMHNEDDHCHFVVTMLS
ncbi:heme NO-binding domain-containing protein [Pseudoalteromonas sp. DL2-H2.2]|uniref:heme NO-binding domain-containing protein n=1 Tax=Pseudoalteromonas sp. DL2-H2.2 TaxID=2908889 RepID=UPI001F1A38E0|nr:heme NO-binding domain-containing protein [Pseudoalteromonas sp. DL2-H2.2]MCF2906903.1 heme NO-binding domain-containing protein [Pseudoalteromonas sp. DL2-H2.2]